MTRSGRRGLKLLLLALLLCGVVVAWLRSPRGAEDLCTLARRQLPGLLNLDVGIGRCELDPLGQAVVLHGLSLFEPNAEQPLLAADRAEVRVGALRPFFGEIELEQIRLVRPRVNLDLSRPSPNDDAPSDCSLDALQRLEIARLDVRNAEVRLRLPGDRAVEILGGDITWRRRRGRADIRLWARRGQVTIRPGTDLELSTLQIDARFDQDNERVEVSRAELALAGLTVGASGTIENLCDPELSLDGNVFVPMSTLALAGGIDEPVEGQVWSRLGVSGKAKAPVLTADVVGDGIHIGPYEPGAFEAQLALEGDTLRIERFETPVGEGHVRAQGTLVLGPGLPLEAAVEIDRVGFGAVTQRAGLHGSWVDFPSTGRGRVSGRLLPTPDLRGDLELRTGRFVLATRAWNAPVEAGRTLLEFERGAVKGGVRVLGDRVELVDMTIHGPRSELVGNASLFFDPDRGMEISGDANLIDFDDFGHLAGIHWSGTGSARFSIAGPYNDPNITSAVSVRDFEFWSFALGVLQGRVDYHDLVLSLPAASGQKGRTPYFGSGELRFGHELSTEAKVTIEQGRIEDLVELMLPMHENVELFVDTLDGDVAGTVELHGPVELFEGTIDMQLSNVRYYERRLGAGRSVIRFDKGETLVLERTVLEGPLGVTSAHGKWGFDGPLDFRFRVDRGSLGELVGPERAKELELDAVLTLAGKVFGNTDVPMVSGYLTSPEVHFAGRKLGSTQLEGRVQGREIQTWGKLFDGARTSLELTARAPYPWSGTATVALPELRPLLPESARAQGLSGSISGSMKAKGNLRDVRGTEATATIDRLTLARRDFSGANDGPVSLAWKNGTLSIDNLLFRGPNTLVSVAGTAGRTLDVDLHGTFDLRLLESFVPWMERSSGRVEVTAAAGGTPDRPTLAGTAEFSDARLSVRDQPYSLRGVAGRVEFSEARVLIQDVHGILNEGRVALRGDVRLDRFTPKRLELNLQLDEISARPVEYLPFTASGELLLVGAPDSLVLSGSIDIVKLRYDQPLVVESLLTNLRTARVPTVGGEETRKTEWLAFDVGIHASGDVRIDNNLARARLRGDLRLTGTNLHPGLLGSIESAEGSQIFFRGNQFTVGQALIEFKDRREIDPVFDLHAQAQVREYLVSLHAFGRMRDPQLLLTADPELAEADILSLLTLGVTSRDESSAAGSVSVIGDALFNVSGLDRQIQRFLPRNPLLRDLSFHISSTYNEASGFVEPTAQLESRFLTERLQLQMTQPVVTGRGTRAQAEYRFHDRLSGQFQWDNDATEELPNFGLDLKLKWEVE